MNTHDKYELPPLPEPMMVDGEPYWFDSHMRAYAHSAIEADRKRNDNWRHAVMCAISHNDYETDAPRRVQQALRLLSDAFHGLPFRESIIDDLIADRQRRSDPVARVNDDGFIVETGLGLAPGTLLYTAPPPADPAQVSSDDERAAQGLPPYSPRHLTEEEWNRLTENGRKAWVKKPDEPEKEPPCET